MSDLAMCSECGMMCEPGEYHPYAACLMFKACTKSETVRCNLSAVQEHGWQIGMEEAAKICEQTWKDAPNTRPEYTQNMISHGCLASAKAIREKAK